jgi:hypothetical protein
MQTEIHHSPAVREAALSAKFPPLELETRPTVGTPQAAYYLLRQNQTLRGWACRDDGPLRPLRLNGRLAWRVADIKKLLGVA